MGVKSTGVRERKPVILPYPKLMKSSALIVLFRCDCIGSVVNTNLMDYPVGYISEDWNMDEFADYHGTVTLENE